MWRGKKQCYLESLWTVRYNKTTVHTYITIYCAGVIGGDWREKRSNYGYYCKDFRGTWNP